MSIHFPASSLSSLGLLPCAAFSEFLSHSCLQCWSHSVASTEPSVPPRNSATFSPNRRASFFAAVALSVVIAPILVARCMSSRLLVKPSREPQWSCISSSAAKSALALVSASPLGLTESATRLTWGPSRSSPFGRVRSLSQLLTTTACRSLLKCSPTVGGAASHSIRTQTHADEREWPT